MHVSFVVVVKKMKIMVMKPETLVMMIMMAVLTVAMPYIIGIVDFVVVPLYDYKIHEQEGILN
jgi:hypothetical protein